MNRKLRRADGKLGQNPPPALAKALSVALQHVQAGRTPEAIAAFRKATIIAPEFSVTHYNFGNALGEAGRPVEAASAFRKAIEITPNFPEAHSNLGAALKEQGMLIEAENYCRKAIELAPSLPIAHFNLGTVLEARRELKDAEDCYRRAIRLKPDFPVAHLNLAMTLLAQGKMREGWEEHEWRWQTPAMIQERRHLAQPRWNGEAGGGRTLLVYSEQGFGDTIQFCRYIPLAAARGLRIILHAPEALLRLLENLPGVDLVIENGVTLPKFDLHIPMMSLPFVFGTEIDTIPSVSPYLHANTEAISKYALRLSEIDNEAPRIGLAWAGNPMNNLPAAAMIDRRRSISLNQLAPLFDVPGLRFFSLQKEKSTIPSNVSLIDLMGEIDDFADTAALIANLDLIISVDTAIAHLAAAIGKPVWLLNRFDSCWRWLAGRSDSPWYPTLQIYRQPGPGDWDSVVSEITRDLGAVQTARRIS